MDVQVSLQLVPDGLAEQLQAVVGRLSVLLAARPCRDHVAQGAPRAAWWAVAAPPACRCQAGMTCAPLSSAASQACSQGNTILQRRQASRIMCMSTARWQGSVSLKTES